MRAQTDMPEPAATSSEALPEDKPCRWCKRSRRHANTIPSGQYKARLYLPFKSAIAHECIPCCRAQTRALKSKIRDDLTAMVSVHQSDDQVLYMFIVFCWEKKFIDPQGCIVKDASLLPAVCKQKISHSNVTTMESGKCMGNLWPTQVFIDYFEYKPDKKSLHTIFHNGQKVTGVILSPSFGLEIGVITLSHKSSAVLEREWKVADNDEEVLCDELDDIWARGQKRMAITCKGEKTNEGEVPKPGRLTQPKQAEEDDFLSDIWGSSAQLVAKSGAPASATAAPKKKIVKVPNRIVSPTASNKQLAERLKMLQSSQQVLLQAKQLVGLFEDERTSSGVGAKTVKSMIDKIDARMTEKHMVVYSADYSMPDDDGVDKNDGGGSCISGQTLDGMQTLGQLTDLKKKLRCIVALAEQTENRVDALQQARAAGLQVTLSTLTTIFNEVANKYLDENMYKEWLALFKSEKSDDQQLSIHIAGSAESQIEFQTKMICSGLLEILRAKDKLEKARHVIAALDEELVQTDGILCLKFKEEMIRHIRIANVTSAADTSLAQIEDDKKKVLSDTSMKLHQAMVHFPTGQLLMAAVDAEVVAAKKDSKMLKELGSATSLIKELVMDNTRFATSQNFAEQHHEKVVDIAKKLHTVEGTSSQRFRNKNADAIKEVQEVLDKQAKDLKDYAEMKFAETFMAPLDELITVLSKPNDVIAADQKQGIIKAFRNKNPPDASSMMFLDFAGEKADTDYKQWSFDINNGITVIVSSIPHFFDTAPGKVDFGNTHVVRLCEFCRAREGGFFQIASLTDKLQSVAGYIRSAVSMSSHAALSQLTCVQFALHVAGLEDVGVGKDRQRYRT